MHKTIILFILLAFTAAFAQNTDTTAAAKPKPKQERPTRDLQKEFQELSVKLALTDSQAVQIKAVYAKYLVQLAELRDKEGDRREKMGAMRDIMQNMDKEINALLTDQQKDKYKEYKQERREKMRARMQNTD